MGSQFYTAVVLGLIAFQAANEPDPAELVARLGATKFANREKAGEDLVKLGRRAIPALKKATASNDPEIRRRAEPLIARIEAAEILKPKRLSRSMTLVVEDVSVTDGNRPSVRVTIRPNGNGLAPRTGFGPRRAPGGTFNRGDALEHIELYDAAGKHVNTMLGEQGGGGDGQGRFSRYRLIVAPVFDGGVFNARAAANLAVPAELRYYEFVQREIEIPFDFRDIPMP